jgi:Na+/H+ antiporter NhaD/arsenite permease-like protein
MRILKKEWLFFIFLSLFFPLYFYLKPSFQEIINSIDFATIRALIALLLITTALKLSKFFDFLAIKTIDKFKNERRLALAFIVLGLILSMFLTNDITLFIIVPLTIAFSNQIKNDLTKMVIFEAIAVNVGSALTPFGNPQNLFLFRQMDISILTFIHQMSFIVIPQIVLLLVFVFVLFKPAPLEIEIKQKIKTDKFLFISSLILFLLFLISLELSFVRYTLIITVLFYLFFKKEVFFKFDYFLIFTFIIMFIDFSLLAKLNFIQNIMHSIPLDFLNTYNISIALSQIISNVPAAIFMTHFSHEYTAIAYGVNIAGNGLLIASLANIIALRFLEKKPYLLFHKYSLTFFIIAYLLTFPIIQKIDSFF